MSQFERTALLLGEEAIKALSRKKVAIFGLGGVGSWCCEALGRAGVGQLALIDHDTVSESNLNRQLVALHSTIGQKKAAVMAARLRDINPDIEITEYPVFYMPENADQIDLSGFDCIVDAIDTVTAKLHLIQTAKALGVPIISSMGTGNKLRPDLQSAIERARNIAAPLNAKRLNKKTPCAVDGRCHDCKSPERICRAMVIHMGVPSGFESCEVVLIGEKLGY